MADFKPPTYEHAVNNPGGDVMRHPYPVVQNPYPPTQQPAYPPPQQPPVFYTATPPPPYDQPMLQGGDKDPINNVNYGYERQADLEANNYDSGSSEASAVILRFDDKSVRLGFIRKVFAILALQMLVTIGMTALFMFHQPTKDYVQQSFPLYIASYVLFFVLYIILVCCSKVARKHPINLILLALFTISLGYLVAAVSTFHSTKIVLGAFGMTLICSGAVIGFACQTKYDITRCSGILFVGCISLFLFGLFGGILVPYGYMRIAHVVYSFLGALLFMGFLAFDIQTIMGGGKYELSPEDYVYAALQLYVDVIYIFLFILQLFNGGK